MLKEDVDYNFACAVLIRTLREFKCLNVSKRNSIDICTASAATYFTESVYFNMSIWPADCCRNTALCTDIVLLRTVYICRIINSPSFNSIYIEDDIFDWVIDGAKEVFLNEFSLKKYGMCVLNALKKLNKSYKRASNLSKDRINELIEKYENKVECFKEDCFIVL